MWLKKKKNILFLSGIVIVSFILYQVYFFITITSVPSNNIQILHVLDHSNVMEIVHVRSDHDKFINENGILRGVLLLNMPRYRADNNNEFKCLKSGEIIPFEYVNDDYCDCEDATDEPSTNACVNGTFYCDTQYKGKPVAINAIPSGMVNDGICDCCDGSDEWLNKFEKLLTQSVALKRHYSINCPNVCHL